MMDKRRNNLGVNKYYLSEYYLLFLFLQRGWNEQTTKTTSASCHHFTRGLNFSRHFLLYFARHFHARSDIPCVTFHFMNVGKKYARAFDVFSRDFLQQIKKEEERFELFIVNIIVLEGWLILPPLPLMMGRIMRIRRWERQ